MSFEEVRQRLSLAARHTFRDLCEFITTFFAEHDGEPFQPDPEPGRARPAAYVLTPIIIRSQIRRALWEISTAHGCAYELHGWDIGIEFDTFAVRRFGNAFVPAPRVDIYVVPPGGSGNRIGPANLAATDAELVEHEFWWIGNTVISRWSGRLYR